MGNITENLKTINNNIAAAAIKSGRTREDIKLIGVTKTIEPERINQLVTAGVNTLGESRVQEFLPKYEALMPVPAPEWHFIGHLQRNKVKFVIDKVAMIHSVDNIALAADINKRAKNAGLIMDILIEINIAGESSKHGIKPTEVLLFSNLLSDFSNIRTKGLMCIAPYVKNPEENRVYFTKMCEILLDINVKLGHNHALTELSMGMSADYVVAIEEGATIVRIGSALFD